MAAWTDNVLFSVILLKIYHDDGNIQYATIGTSTDDGAYLEKLVQPSSIKREFDILGYSFKSNRAVIEVENADEVFSRLLHDRSLYGRKVEIYIGIEGIDPDDFILLFNGRVLRREVLDDGGALSFYDVKPNLPNVPNAVLTSSDFPDILSENENQQTHLVAGVLDDSSDNKRRLLLVHVNDSTPDDDWLVGVGRILEVVDVYVNGSVQTISVDYDIDHVRYADKVGFHTVVNFTIGNKPAHTDNVTADVRGMGYDFIRLQKDSQIVAGGEHVVDSWAMDCDGSTEGAYNQTTLETATEWCMELRLIIDAFVEDDCLVSKMNQNQGGKKGVRLVTSSTSGTVKLYLGKADGNSEHLITKTGATIATKIRIKIGVTSGWLGWIRVDTGGGFGAAATLDISSDHYTNLAARYFTTMMLYSNDPVQFQNHADGKIDYCRVSFDGDQNDTSDITNMSNKYEFERNLNDSLGSNHLTGENIVLADYIEFDGHDEDNTYRDFYPHIEVADCDLTTQADYSVNGLLTEYMRYRSPDNSVWGYLTTAGDQLDLVYFIYRPSLMYLQYNVVTQKVNLAIRNGDNTAWVVPFVSDPLGFDPFMTNGEWQESSFFIDFINGTAKWWINNDLIIDESFTGRNFGATSSDWRSANHDTDYIHSTDDRFRFIDLMDVDQLGMATVDVSNRRLHQPTEHEFANSGFFFDFNSTNIASDNCTSQGGFAGLASPVLRTTDGFTGTLSESAGGTHQYLKELNSPMEDIRDVLQRISEPVVIASVYIARDALESLAADTGSGIVNINVEGQWGGICNGTARELLRLMTMCLDSQLFQRRSDNAWVLAHISFGLESELGTEYTQNDHIEDRGFGLKYQEDLKNHQAVTWAKNFSGDELSSGEPHLSSAVAAIESSAERLGEWYYEDSNLELDFIRESEGAKAVALSILRKKGTELALVTFNTSLRAVENDIGDLILLTHSKGPGDEERWGLDFQIDPTKRIFGDNKSFVQGDMSFEFEYDMGPLSTIEAIWDRATSSKQVALIYVSAAGAMTFQYHDSGDIVRAINDAAGYTGNEILRYKLSFEYSTDNIKMFKYDFVSGLWSLVKSGNMGGNMLDRVGAVEGTGTINTSSTTGPSNILRYMKIAYGIYDETVGPLVVAPDLTFYPSKNGAPYITEGRNLLMVPVSSSEPIPVKWQNAGCTKKQFAIQGISHNLLSGKSKIEAMSLDVESGGTFTINDTAPPGGGGGGGGDPIPPPPPEYEYDEYTIPASNLEYVHNLQGLPGDTSTDSPIWHGTQEGPVIFSFRAQYDFPIPNFTGDVIDAKITFGMYGVFGALEFIKLYRRTVDVDSITTIDQGISTYYGQVAAGGGTKVIIPSEGIYADIESLKSSSMSFTHQAMDLVIFRLIAVNSAVLWFKVKRTL